MNERLLSFRCHKNENSFKRWVVYWCMCSTYMKRCMYNVHVQINGSACCCCFFFFLTQRVTTWVLFQYSREFFYKVFKMKSIFVEFGKCILFLSLTALNITKLMIYDCSKLIHWRKMLVPRVAFECSTPIKFNKNRSEWRTHIESLKWSYRISRT